MTPAQIQTVVARLALAAALATVAAVLVGGRDGRPGGAVAAAMLLGTLPYAALLMLGRWSEGVVPAQLVVLGGLVLALFFALGIYALAFWVDPGSNSGRAFVLVPLFQSVPVAVAGVAAAVLRWRAHAGRPTEGP